MNTLSVGSLTLLHMTLLLQQGTGQRRNLPLGKLAAHKSPTMADQGGIGLACPLWLGGMKQRRGEGRMSGLLHCQQGCETTTTGRNWGLVSRLAS